MAWYNVGTVTVTNGSTVVTGAGTDFLNNVTARDSFALASVGTSNEIASVDSKTQLTLARPWLGATANGATYFIQPTVGIYVDLALRALNMVTPFQAVLDGIGQGLISDGTAAAPGVRFLNDQDTGLTRLGPNIAALVAGGVARLLCSSAGITAIGTDASMITVSGGAGTLRPALTLNAAESTTGTGVALDLAQQGTITGRIGSAYEAGANFGLSFYSYSPAGLAERARISGGGNLLVGATTSNGFGGAHRIKGPIAALGNYIASMDNGTTVSAYFLTVDQTGYSQQNAAMWVGKASNSGRSINAAGTINTGGADYAEYMFKADSCGTIAAGDVCGVDSDGKLTRTFAAAISFVVKSTNPSFVGGDIWAEHIGLKPEGPGPEPVPPGEAPTMPNGDDHEALAQWHEAAVAHTALVIAYPARHATWVSEQANYEAALHAWEEALETARQCVDRIAFCGQVPVNVTGDFAIGDYIIAVANGSGIKAIAVAEADITFDQYRRRIGKVWAVRDGRAWIDVQHG